MMRNPIARTTAQSHEFSNSVRHGANVKTSVRVRVQRKKKSYCWAPEDTVKERRKKYARTTKV
jgi:hypothetical protein